MDNDHLYDNLNPRSEEVQEIMGRVPHWILRRGIALLFLIVILLLVGSCFFHYPEKVTTQVHVLPSAPSARLTSPSAGHFKEVIAHNGDSVQESGLLAVLERTDGKEFLTDSIFSPISGIVNTPRFLESGTPVTAEETLFVITQAQSGSLRLHGALTAAEKGKVTKGQRVLIRTMDDNIIEGRVNSISSVPDTEGNYFFDVTASGPQQTNGETTAAAAIIVKDKRLIETLLQPLMDYIKR